MIIRLGIKLFTKVTPRFEYWICTNFGISDESYGFRNYPLEGLGKGIILSESRNRHMSFFTPKELEEKGLGFSNVGSITLETMLKKFQCCWRNWYVGK